ncbi:MAG: 30S ribosomal protein S6 [Clostridiales bacterium]|nr:30S ribosomal protein S6 [Clostridiales bacterium]
MTEIKHNYESIFVVDLQLGEEGIKNMVEKFTSLIASNGEITEVNEWGKKRLAYPINDLTEGYYVLVKFVSNGQFPAELERIYNITEGILRSMVVKEG